MRAEVETAGIALPALLAATKSDDAEPAAVERIASAFSELEVVPVSVLDDESLERLREAIWRLTGLVRVYLRRGQEVDGEPVALHPGATVEDVADEIHHELAERFGAARVWGPSARFDGQRVGRAHVVLDGDVVEILR
ncbi:MAG: TGS domain-containing protein [Gaiellaceae bacterium]